MDDLKQRLREIRDRPFKEADRIYIVRAADEIERLEKLVATLEQHLINAPVAERQLASARKALEITQKMIHGELIENAIIDTQTKQSLGDAIKAALTNELRERGKQ